VPHTHLKSRSTRGLVDGEVASGQAAHDGVCRHRHHNNTYGHTHTHTHTHELAAIGEGPAARKRPRADTLTVHFVPRERGPWSAVKRYKVLLGKTNGEGRTEVGGGWRVEGGGWKL
jgi:hypothetical protein